MLSRGRASWPRILRSPKQPATHYRRAVDDGRAEKVCFATLETLERAAGTQVEKLAE